MLKIYHKLHAERQNFLHKRFTRLFCRIFYKICYSRLHKYLVDKDILVAGSVVQVKA